jgi:hypothetical protein
VPNDHDFDILSRILRKLTGDRFYGNMTFVLSEGKIVHTDKHETKKPDDLRKILDRAM